MTSWSLRAARLPLGVVWVLGLIAGTASAQPIATLEAATGQVSVLRLGQTQAVAPAMPLQLHDVLVTRQGRASVRFLSDGSVLRVGPESRVEIDENATGREIKLFFGRIWAHVIRWKERPTRFSTGSTIAAIRGTELSASVATDGNETEVAVLEGSVETKTDTGNPVTLQGGQTATGAKGRAAAIDARVKPQDAVQWALYYPPVLYARAGAPESASQRAAAKLAAGSVEEAAKDLDAALKANPNDASALALSAIVSVATNRADAALDTAKKAVAADPKSSAALIALSYAQQARFDLEGARASLEQAVTLEPSDALAWARLAEIRSSLGESGASLEAAQQGGRARARTSSRTQTVLGFSQLFRGRDRRGRGGLPEGDRARRLRPAAAARPRASRRSATATLAEGTRELEIAVSLDPGQAPRAQLPRQGLLRGEARPTSTTREYDAGEGAGPERPDAVVLRRDRQADHEPAGRGARRASRRRSSSTTTARSTARGCCSTRTSPRAARASAASTATSASRTCALVEGWNSVNTDPTQLLGPPAARRLLRRPAAPRDRPRERAAPVADAPAAQHHADPAAPRREQPVPASARRARRRSPSTSSTRSSTANQVNVPGQLSCSARTTP